MSFESLGLSDPLVRGVRAAGYRSTTVIQDESIPHILRGTDLFGVGKTGSGKTAAFCLPMLQRLANLTPVGVPHGVPANHRRTRALVLSPTRESAHQIGERLKVYGQHMSLTHAVLHAGGNHSSQTLALRNGVDILVATPGWLHELMVQGYVYLAGLQFVVIDEADRMLHAGMLSYLTNILRALPANRQSVLFSETIGEAVSEFAGTYLKHPVNVGFKPVKSKPGARAKSTGSATATKVVRRPALAGSSSARATSTGTAVEKTAGDRPAAKVAASPAKSRAVRVAAAKPARSVALTKSPKVAVPAKSVAAKGDAKRPAAGKAAALVKGAALAKSKSAKPVAAKPKSTLAKSAKVNGAKVNSAKEKQARVSSRVAVKPRSAVRAKVTRTKPPSTKSAARGRSA
jgi:hypothetical protein